MRWQKVLLGSLPVVVTSLGLWGLWDAFGVSESPVASAPSVCPSASVAAVPGPVAASSAPASGLSSETETEGKPLVVSEAESSGDEDVAGEAEPRDSAYYASLFQKRGEALSEHALWRTFVGQPGSLGVLVKAVEQLAGGDRPLVFATLSFLPSPAPFRGVRSGGSWVMSPETEQRFSVAVEELCKADPKQVSALIKDLEPELDRLLHEEFGYPPEENFRKLLFECLEVILKTPVPSESPRLVQVTSRLYRYEVPELEALNGGQKFVLRLGPANQVKLQDYLRRLWEAL